MLTKTRVLLVSISVMSLSACVSDYFGGYDDYQSNPKQGSMLYPEGYDSNATLMSNVPEKQTVSVPETYHVGAYRTPVSPKDMDRNWIDSQNAQSYTIELADSDKPSQVANAMSQAPKNERMAEIKYEQSGKAYYKGVYGSYANYEDAQQALKALPESVQKGAGIKSWNNIQQLTH